VIQLSKGCPSEMRDAAFSSHYIDTHHLAGQEITIEFNQNTKHQGLGYFTLLDNVLYIPEGQFLLSTSQPIAVAGTGLTTSGTFYLDPRASVDPDNSPVELSYRWFIDGEDSVREIDMPCVNLNDDFQLSPGNNTATLYVNDGFHYAADTIRFVIPEDTQNGNGSNGSDDTDTPDDSTDSGNGVVDDDTNLPDTGGFTLTDPANECDVDLDEVIIDPDEDGDGSDGEDGDNGGEIPGGGGSSGPVVDLNSPAGVVPSVNFSIGGSPVTVANTVTISDPDGDDIVSVTVSIQNAVAGDSLILPRRDGLSIAGSDSSTIIISQTDSSAPPPASSFANAVEAITFQYVVPTGESANLNSRIISYSANDGLASGPVVISTVDINP